MLRSTRRGLETWHGRDGVTLADERARQRGTQTSTYTGAPVLDPTWERPEVKFLRATRQSRRGGATPRSTHVRNAPLATVGPKMRPVDMGQQQTHAAQQINFIIRSPRQLGQ